MNQSYKLQVHAKLISQQLSLPQHVLFLSAKVNKQPRVNYLITTQIQFLLFGLSKKTTCMLIKSYTKKVAYIQFPNFLVETEPCIDLVSCKPIVAMDQTMYENFSANFSNNGSIHAW